MDIQSTRGLQQFKNLVALKFQLYNSLFTSLPFHRIEKTGILLSLLLNNCEEGYKKKQSPTQIIDDFFKRHTTYLLPQEQFDLLFRFIQYIERQVVLFDALEDAAFKEVNDMNGVGTLKQLENDIINTDQQSALVEKFKNFAVRLVLTAHPTQFYPGSVLGIINDLNRALATNNTVQINMYLQQLGKTPFFKKQKPTPYDEAINLIWYLENVFYEASGKIVGFLKNQFTDALDDKQPILCMGFWPGGDRDGNPFVKAATTIKVADALRGAIIKCYYVEIRKIKRRLTFEGVENVLQELENELYSNIFIPDNRTDLTKEKIIAKLEIIRTTIIEKHNGLFLHLVESLLNKVHLFGLHFASLDIRQESTIHHKVIEHIADTTNALPANYATLNTNEKIHALCNITESIASISHNDELLVDTFESFKAIIQIQQNNGAAGCNRYIISQCNTALQVFEIYGLAILAGFNKQKMLLDIVPLFETVEDLKNAADIMNDLYSNTTYAAHLKNRNNTQTIMLGFSDGTKDGGYLMANWSIYKAKEALTSISKNYGIEVIFFDGRGGPPARGGGKTHKFYASMGQNISNKEIQLTVQGQTVSSNFGTVDAAQFNMEQLLNAGISNGLFVKKENTLAVEEEALLDELAELSYQKYTSLKNHPLFTDYLSQVSPLKYYSETNIGSRPAKRNGSSQLSFKDLRAIPYVGAWAQLKQNVTGHFGVGSALQKMDELGKLAEVKKLYHSSLYFKTLLDNCEMAMKKCYFPLTEYLSNDEKYGDIWNMIYEEHLLTKKYVLLLSNKSALMDDYPVDQLSIQMRERIVLPLLTIQQYALIHLREIEDNLVPSPHIDTYKKLVVRSSFGIINAGRNSA